MIMIRRLLTIFPAVYKVLHDHGEHNLILDTDEISKLEKLRDLLSKFEEATVKVSSEKKPTAGLILPILYTLRKHLTEAPGDINLIKKMKSEMMKDLQKRYQGEDVQKMLALCSVVHPRFKALAWMTTEHKASIYQSMTELAIALQDAAAAPVPVHDEMPRPQVEDNPPASEQDFFDSTVFEDAPPQVQDLASLVEDELKRYKSEPRPPQNIEVVEWWRKRRHSYPLLTKVAVYFLMIPATSVPSERVFSVAGQIVNKKRSSLAPDNVNRLIFLHTNADHYIL